jgi:glycerol-3-phosphate dehydrogenase (NAD(P)+)
LGKTLRSIRKSDFVGVIGAGSFGTTVAQLLSQNDKVLLYTRSIEKALRLNESRETGKFRLSDRIIVTSDIEYISTRCKLLFPILPSNGFAQTIREFSPYLRPSHMIIHGTKGLDLRGMSDETMLSAKILRRDVRTMSEVIIEETNVIRVGCLSGPNLAKEIIEGQPTATVVASQFDEVIEAGQKHLSSGKFFVFGSHDLLGAELAGAFKNIIAIGTGMLEGMGMGRNLQSLFIVRCLREIIHLGKALGSSSKAFLGTAGIGDIIATSLSHKSRNFNVGLKLAKGMELGDILNEMDEVAEGIRTLRIAHFLAYSYDIITPIIHMLFRVVYEGEDIEKGINQLMRYPQAPDVDFL